MIQPFCLRNQVRTLSFRYVTSQNVANVGSETGAPQELGGDINGVIATPEAIPVFVNLSRPAYHAPTNADVVIQNLSRAIYDRIGLRVLSDVKALNNRHQIAPVTNNAANRNYIQSMEKPLDDSNIPVDGRAWYMGINAWQSLTDRQYSNQIGRALLQTDRLWEEDAYGVRRGTGTIDGTPARRLPGLDNVVSGNNNDTSDIILGNFRDCVVVLWGGPEIIIDEVTNTNHVVIHAYQDFDIVLPRHQSFATSNLTGF